jgi:ABC-type transport system substrate-binding protein
VEDKKMKWKSWPATAITHKLTLVGWPDGVPAPGPKFKFHSLTARELKAVIGSYIDYREYKIGKYQAVIPDVVKWDDGEVNLTIEEPWSNRALQSFYTFRTAIQKSIWPHS